MNWDLISAVIFYSIVGILIYKYRDKFERMYKIFIVYKTKRSLNLMRKLAKFKPFWKIFSTIAIPVAIFFMAYAGVMLFSNLQDIVAGVGAPGVGVVIPGVRVPGSPIFVPFWPGIIAIAVLAIVHEFSHGIVAAMEDIDLKNTGFGFLAILPLAFVELDEKQLMEASPLKRMRILASGAFANVMLWLVLSFVLALFFVPFVSSVTVPQGIRIMGVDEGLPAQVSGMEAEDLIIGINQEEILTQEQFLNYLNEVEPESTITIHTERGSFEVETTFHPEDDSRAYLGVNVMEEWDVSQEASEKYGLRLSAFLWIFEVLKWTMILNLLVGIMNFLPIWALDGGAILHGMFSYVIKNEKILAITLNIIFAFFLTLIVLNVIGPIIF